MRAAVDGSVSVRFALYDALDAATALWEETRTLDVTAGAFTAYLGETTDLAPSLFRDNGSLWLGITVDADDEMDRVELGSAAFAAVAQHLRAVLAAGSVDNMEAVMADLVRSGKVGVGFLLLLARASRRRRSRRSTGRRCKCSSSR